MGGIEEDFFLILGQGGKIMKMGNTFMTIGSQKFLAAIFRSEKMFLGIFSVENIFRLKICTSN
jgi:hypothetical protein